MIYQDKVAVVTGSTGGLGEAIAKKLAREGAAGIVVSGRRESAGERVTNELRQIGCKAIFVKAELTDPQQCRAIISAAEKEFGVIHGLVNSAGYTGRGSIEETPLAEWDLQFAINVRAPFLLIQETVRVMQRHKTAGSIVNIGSVASHCGQNFLTPYSAAKAALNTLTLNVAQSQRQHKIRVNAVLPGWMDTEGEHATQKKYHDAPDDWLEKAEAGQPMGKLIKPDEVANLVALLLSDSSGVMTGALIDYDQHVVPAAD